MKFSLLILLISLQSVFATENDPYIQLEHNPALWPFWVKLTQEIPANDTTHSPKIKSGTRGMLVRFENDHLVWDSGRNGVHLVDPKWTDILESSQRIATDPKEKNISNLTAFLSTNLRTVRNDLFVKVLPENLLQDQTFLFIYFSLNDPTLSECLNTVQRELAPEKNACRVILMPAEWDAEEYLPLFTGRSEQWTTPALQMRQGITAVLNHPIKSTALSWVLCGSNGEILKVASGASSVTEIAPFVTKPLRER
jgi:hypothetical protein